jgi:HNH endonuclease
MGKRCCGNCTYGERLRSRWLRVILSRWPGLLICFQHPDAPGEISEVVPSGVCSNFRARPGRRERIEAFHPPGTSVRYIPLTKGKYAIVDAEDYPALAQYKWHAQLSKNGSVCYACRNSGRKTLMMHREIMKPPKGMVVDHINHNGANNRRRNLRVCTQAQNTQNKRTWSTGKSRFRGVSRQGDKWQAAVRYQGQMYYAGVYDDEVAAAKARDRKALALAGEFAVLNFPQASPSGGPTE